MDLSSLVSGVKPEEQMHSGALPTGNYNVKIEGVEGKPTKAGGKALNIKMRVFGEKYSNAVLFDFINIEHPTSKQAADIGKGRVAKIAMILDATNTDQWIGKEISVFAAKKSSAEWGDQNEIKAYNEYVLDNTPEGLPANGASISATDLPF